MHRTCVLHVSTYVSRMNVYVIYVYFDDQVDVHTCIHVCICVSMSMCVFPLKRFGYGII